MTVIWQEGYLSSSLFCGHYVYLNPYLQGRELCDALIILKNKAIIFQIKNTELKDNEFSRRKFEKNMDQCRGAHRALMNCTDTVEFVNHAGIAESIDTSKIDEAHCVTVYLSFPQFVYDMGEEGEAFIHPISYESLQKILGELSALPDLFRYLSDKKNLRGHMVIVEGRAEENLFALWILGEYSFGKFTGERSVIAKKDSFDLLINEDKQYRIRKQEDAKYIPYWEKLISLSLDTKGKELSDILVDNGFLSRRALGKQLKEFFQKIRSNKHPDAICLHAQMGGFTKEADTLYLFIGLGECGGTGLSFSRPALANIISTIYLKNSQLHGHKLPALRRVVFLMTDCVFTPESEVLFGLLELPPNWADIPLEDESLDTFTKYFGLEGDPLKFSLIANYDEGITPISLEDMKDIKGKIDKSDQAN